MNSRTLTAMNQWPESSFICWVARRRPAGHALLLAGRWRRATDGAAAGRWQPRGRHHVRRRGVGPEQRGTARVKRRREPTGEAELAGLQKMLLGMAANLDNWPWQIDQSLQAKVKKKKSKKRNRSWIMKPPLMNLQRDKSINRWPTWMAVLVATNASILFQSRPNLQNIASERWWVSILNCIGSEFDQLMRRSQNQGVKEALVLLGGPPLPRPRDRVRLPRLLLRPRRRRRHCRHRRRRHWSIRWRAIAIRYTRWLHENAGYCTDYWPSLQLLVYVVGAESKLDLQHVCVCS